MSDDAIEAAEDAAKQVAGLAVLEDMERQYMTVCEERDSLRHQLENTQTELYKTQEDLTKQHDESRKAIASEEELDATQQKMIAAQEEKENLQERMSRMQVESDRLREEISRLTSTNAEMTKKVKSAEIEAKLKESEAIPLFHEKERLQTELDSLQKHVSWLETELQAKQQDYQHLKTQSSDRTIQLQLQLDQTKNEMEGLEATLSVQQKLELDLQDKLQTLSRDNLELRKDFQNYKETTSQEIQEERHVIDLQKEHLARWQKRYEDLVRENEGLKKLADRALQTGDQELESAKSELESKYKALLQEQASTYEAKLKSQRTGAALLLDDTAEEKDDRLDEGEGDGPLSMTDLYERLENTKSELRSERKQRQYWELQLKRVQKDLQGKFLQMKVQAEEHELATTQLQEYHKRLQSAVQERDDAIADAKEAARETAALEKKVREEHQAAEDLAKQVQALLMSRATGSAPAGDIPTTLQDVQQQNMRLLQDHRRLTRQVEELETRMATDTLRTKLDAAEEEVDKLNQQRKQQEIMVEKIVQQRDLYRALLNKHDSDLLGSESDETTALQMAQKQSERAKKYEHRNTELEGELKSVRAELDRATRDKEDVQERITRYDAVNAELTTNVGRLQKELMNARGDVGRSQSDANYHKEKCERLEEALGRARQETAQVNSARHELQKINADLQRSLSNAQGERGRLEGEKRHAEGKVRLVETQLATARAAEARLAEENSRLRSEAARQGVMVESIRRIENKLSVQAESEMETLKNELQAVTEKLADADAKHSTHVENMTGRIHELEARVADLQGSNHGHQAEAIKAKKELLDCKEELQGIKSDYKNVAAQLRAAKRKLGQDADTEDVEVTMQNRVDSLESELQAARDEISALEQRAQNYQKLAEAGETEVSQMRKAAENFKTELNKEIEDLKHQLKETNRENMSRQDMIRELTEDLAGQSCERENQIKELRARVSELETEKKNNEMDYESAKATAASLQHDMKAAREEARAALANYERELGLHAQARTELRSAQEAADEEARLRAVAEGKLESIKRDMEQQHESWEEEKVALQEASKLLEQRIEDARQQNDILHGQVETLNATVEKIQTSRLAAATSEGVEATSGMDIEKVTSELRELVKFLRSENEVIQTQLDTAKRAADRERAAANVIRRSLDEARAELKVLRETNASHEASSKDRQAVEASLAKLREIEEQVNLLRDSNKLLRVEADKLRSKLVSTQTELDSTKQAAQPTEDVQRELGGKIATLQAEKESLARELESWKGRMTTLVSNFNQIDPQEHKKLAEKVAEMTKEQESLNAWKKATEDENTRMRGISKRLKEKNTEQLSTIQSQQKQIKQLTSDKKSLESASSSTTSTAKERDELKTKLSAMEKDAVSMKKQLEGTTQRYDKLRDRLREFQATIRELEGREKSLKEQLAQASIQTSAALPAPATAPAPERPQTQAVEAVAAKTTKRSEAIVPQIPPGGFKFGPSEKSGSEGKSMDAPSALRLSATSCVSKVEQKKGMAPIPELKNPSVIPEKKGSMTETPATTGDKSSATPGELERRLSGETKELTMKEKILRKKQLLEEKMKVKLKRRQQEDSKNDAGSAVKKAKVEKPPTLAPVAEEPVKEPESKEPMVKLPSSAAPAELSKEPTGEPPKSDEPELSMSKGTEAAPPSKDSTAAETSRAANESIDKETTGEERKDEAPLAKKARTEVASKVGEPAVAAETKDAEEAIQADVDEDAIEEDDVVDAEVIEDDDDDDDIVEAEPVEDNDEEPASAPASNNPFTSTTALGPSSFGQASMFGKAPDAPVFGKSSNWSSSSSFLNMKPPGSSSEAPTFSFGSSPNITLPTPSLTPVPAPFGAFSASTASFGVRSRPLFGAPEEETRMDDEDEEGDAGMDAQD